MKVTIYYLTQVIPIFQKIAETPFPARQAFMLNRLTKTLDAEMNNFSDFRQKTVMEFAQKDENGQIITENGNVKIKEGMEEQFKQEMVDLLNTEIEIDAEPFPLEWMENVTLTPQQVSFLTPFIKEN